MGVVQRAMVRSCPHVWFERAEMKDRHLVTKRLVFHSSTPACLLRLVFACLSRLYFSLCGCSGARRGWHFPGSKVFWQFCISHYPNKSMFFGKLLLNSDSYSLDSSVSLYHIFTPDPPDTRCLMYCPKCEKKNSSKVQYVDIYTARKWFPLPLCVASRLRDHVNDKTKLPILIFPEGKCDHVYR